MAKSEDSPETGHVDVAEHDVLAAEEGPIAVLLKNPVLIAVSLFANLGSFMYGFDNTILATALSFTPFQ